MPSASIVINIKCFVNTVWQLHTHSALNKGSLPLSKGHPHGGLPVPSKDLPQSVSMHPICDLGGISPEPPPHLLARHVVPCVLDLLTHFSPHLTPIGPTRPGCLPHNKPLHCEASGNSFLVPQDHHEHNASSTDL